MQIIGLIRGVFSGTAQIPISDPSLGGDARISMEALADGLAAMPQLANAGGAAVGGVTFDSLRIESQIATPGTTSGPIDTSKQSNPRTISGNVTLSFSAQPPASDTYFGSSVFNAGSSDVVVSIPISYSMRQQASIASFPLKAGGIADLVWAWDGARYKLFGEPVREPFQAVITIVGATSARSYGLLPSTARALVITGVYSVCASGTDVATVRIGATPLGGTPNAVSSAGYSQSISSANVANIGSSVSVLFAGGAVDPQIQISGYYK